MQDVTRQHTFHANKLDQNHQQRYHLSLRAQSQNDSPIKKSATLLKINGVAVHGFSGLGQCRHTEATLFNSNRSCSAEQFDNNLPQLCCFSGRLQAKARYIRYISNAMVWRVWARIRATKCFRAVPETYNGAMNTGYLCGCCTQFARELLTS